MIDKIDVAVVLNEKQSTVMFPTIKDQTDMNYMFMSNNIKLNNGVIS